MGDIAPPKNNQPVDLNHPIPSHLLEKSPSFKKKSEEKKTEKNFSEQINTFIHQEFNTMVGKNLGLTGIQRIYAQFEIDKKGVVQNIKARAPHPLLEKEVLRVLQKIPVLIPGTYKNQPISSIYSLPIVYKTEE